MDVKRSDESVIQVAKDILDRLPPPFDIEVAAQKYPINLEESLNAILVQEMTRYNILLSAIRTHSTTVLEATKGMLSILLLIIAENNNLINIYLYL